MKLHIKNMVCNRCKMVVKAELEKLGLKPLVITLGEVTFNQEVTINQLAKISESLKHYGFELLENKKNQVAEQIKIALINFIQDSDSPLKINLSAYLSHKLDREYVYLSATFTEIENQTIEKYFIAQKIERAKEMLSYGEHTLSEIAYQLSYSSVAHLSNQFKKVAGLTPTAYKTKGDRKSLDQV